ncbi:hypothetical protein [Streptomyces sp. WAC01280]|uniref:hypothetical protein n=1 Tax=Streptomyces sp. WAC01280 TaxID=2487424 RepID=UPI000F7756B7|nr:hypothetical protein [Streptomyces sp. WAC01280]RSS56786.1 hypothetical protein EF909_11955 [Streptomyces sp. WAC01280]
MNTLYSVKPAQDAKAPASARPTTPATNFASASVPRHLARGAVGFGLIIGSIALVPVAGPATLLAAPLALIAFRGCPTCWMVGLAQTISRGRLERRCEDGVCTLTKAHPAPTTGKEPTADAPTRTAA